MPNHLLLDDLDIAPKSAFPYILKIYRLFLTIGIITGLLANVINGWVSSEYFINIMHWPPNHVFGKVIRQGILEGAFYAFLGASLFSIIWYYQFRKRGIAPFYSGQWKGIALLILLGYLLGGLLTMAWAYFFPQQYVAAIYKAPVSLYPRLAYAWVGGAIIGQIIGGLIAVIWSAARLFQTKRTSD